MNILYQLTFAIMFNRALIILHLRHILTAKDGETSFSTSDSRTKSVDAALKILAYQSLMEEETEPAGTLYTIRWKLHSTVSHDFLVATTFLATCLYQDMGSRRRQHVAETSQKERGAELERVEIALKHSHRIWQNNSPYSHQASEVADFLGALFVNLSLNTSSDREEQSLNMHMDHLLSPGDDETIPVLEADAFRLALQAGVIPCLAAVLDMVDWL